MTATRILDLDIGPTASPQAAPVSVFFWLFAGLLVFALAIGLPLSGQIATSLATALILIGGLPHGGHDLSLARRAFALGPWATALFIGAYLGAAAAMMVLWAIAPLLALIAFLALSSSHFADDWRALPERLGSSGQNLRPIDPIDGMLRLAAGFAVIAAAALGQPDPVIALFTTMAGPSAEWIARVVIAAAPVTLLVTAVAIWQTWHTGARKRAAAMALTLALLVATPPIVGFALFFALLHAPRHMHAIRPMTGPGGAHFAAQAFGVLMALLAVALWLAFAPLVLSGIEVLGPAAVFQLLSVVAVPHLACSNRLAKFFGRIPAADN